jgi:hypothetical protein
LNPEPVNGYKKSSRRRTRIDLKLQPLCKKLILTTKPDLVNRMFILTSKTRFSLRAVSPTGRKLGQDSLLIIVGVFFLVLIVLDLTGVTDIVTFIHLPKK